MTEDCNSCNNNDMCLKPERRIGKGCPDWEEDSMFNKMLKGCDSCKLLNWCLRNERFENPSVGCDEWTFKDITIHTYIYTEGKEQ